MAEATHPLPLLEVRRFPVLDYPPVAHRKLVAEAEAGTYHCSMPKVTVLDGEAGDRPDGGEQLMAGGIMNPQVVTIEQSALVVPLHREMLVWLI